MAIAGEPMGRRHAVVLYSAQTTYGTPVTPATAVGAFTTDHTQRSSNMDIRGPGSANFLARKGGSTYTEWSLRSEGLQTGSKTLLTKAARVGGVLPLITLGLGYSDDAGTPARSADQIQDCKVGSLSLGYDASGGHAPLSCEMSGVGGLIAVLTTLAPATLSTTPWLTYEVVLTRAAGAYPVRSFNVQLNHNLSRDHVIPGSAPGSFVRGHSYLTEHDETVSGSIQSYSRSAVSVQASTISQFAMVLTSTNLVDSVVLTLTFATMDFDNERMETGPDGIFWSWDFTAKTLVIT